MCGFINPEIPIKLDCGAVSKFLNQLDILNNIPDARIKIIVKPNECHMVGNTSEIVFDSDALVEEYELTLKLNTFKSVIFFFLHRPAKIPSLLRDDSRY
jgi:hypothetical protein